MACRDPSCARGALSGACDSMETNHRHEIRTGHAAHPSTRAGLDWHEQFWYTLRTTQSAADRRPCASTFAPVTVSTIPVRVAVAVAVAVAGPVVPVPRAVVSVSLSHVIPEPLAAPASQMAGVGATLSAGRKGGGGAQMHRLQSATCIIRQVAYLDLERSRRLLLPAVTVTVLAFWARQCRL